MFYTDIIYLLLALVLFGSWPAEELLLRPVEILLLWLIKEGLFIGLVAFYLRKAKAPADFLRRQAHLKVLAFFFFATDVFALDFPGLLAHFLPTSWPFLQDSLGLLLFLQYLVLLWTVSAFYETREPLARVSVTSYVLAHLRMLLPFLLPWFLVNLLLEGGLSLWGQEFLSRYQDQVELLYIVVFVLSLVIMVPPLSVKVWQCKPLPSSNLRRIIEEYLHAQRTKVQEILIWGAFEGRLLTAGVIGIFRRFRYLLITPGLLAALEEPEVLSVVAHEVGHLKRHHMWWLLIFFLSFSVLVYAAFPPVYLGILAYFPWPALLLKLDASYVPEIVLSILMLLLVFFYFRVLFGLYLRNFERQADLYCLESLGTAEGLIRSLQKIAVLTGRTERLPSWHHGSIAERIQFLRAATLNPRLIKAHHRKVRLLLTVYLVIVLGLTLLAWQVPRSKLERLANLNYWKAELLERAQYFPKAETFDLLAEVALEQGREEEALAYYEKALSLAPDDPKILNNLAWLLVSNKYPRLRNPQRAKVLALKAVEKEPLAIYLDTLAEAFFVLGDRDRACMYETLALTRAKEAPDFYDQLAFYRQQKERFCRAAR